ncbi:tRNA (adenosine(37)-N6)-threonylcarbamoyltransferase complex dimerization subunit type 1 TsaB [Nesterenkonia xinjiangensis]|uniref:tRNA threonylcarbamoyl adenosine modification protein YeaZ n=1 Tax=Nesterenkonia xinjiangensis TaxID=225327 RepID=A0A7Z0GJX8_9MICC|nr:tRNA threonylcarbamoyl adenosine modification protein YeaZ [Nesterenkonia xinjiangensis]
MLLAIDSSAGASAAVVHDGEVLASWRTDATTTHAEVLASAVGEVMDRAGVTGARLDAVVVGVGPAPFTGLRVGLVLAHSLAEVWHRPLHGICSLDSPARRAISHGLGADAEFLVAVDARRREVYWGRYRAAAPDADAGGASWAAAELIDGPHVGPAAELPALGAVGVGVTLYPEQLGLPPGAPDEAGQWTADAAELALLAESRPQARREPLPLYLRESDAKVPVRRKRATA